MQSDWLPYNELASSPGQIFCLRWRNGWKDGRGKQGMVHIAGVTFEYSPESGESVYNWILFMILFHEIIMQLHSKLVIVVKWCCKKRYRMLCLCGVHRDGLVFSTSRTKFCVVSIEAKMSCFLTAYGKSIVLLQLLLFIYKFSTEWTQCCNSCSSAHVMHSQTAHLCSSHVGVLVPVVV